MEEQSELQESHFFDFKAFLYRAISYWKWFLLILIIGLYVVYHQNIRKEFPYSLRASIIVQDDKNPLFTSNTSLIFNYGGVSGKVQDVLLNLKSRKHHEKVVDSLNLYLTYLKQGRFYKKDVYKSVPFNFKGVDTAFQIIGHPIKISFLNQNSFELSYDFGESQFVSVQNFNNKKIKRLPLSSSTFSKKYEVNEYIDLPFLKGRIERHENMPLKAGQEFFIKYNSFNATVSGFIRSFTVLNQERSPLLVLKLINRNKAKIVDYLKKVIY